MLKKRIFTLGFPYLLISAFGIATVVVLQLIPFSRPYFNNFSIEKSEFGDWLYVWLVTPVPFQLWFIRFLVFYFIFYPIIYFGVKYFKILFLLLLIYFWASDTWQSLTGITKIEYEGAVFFATGIFAAIHRIPLKVKIQGLTMAGIFLVWMGWVAYRTDLLFVRPIEHYGLHYHILGITFVGFILFWFGYDSVSEKLHNSRWLQNNAAFSFGIFLFHEPALTIIKKLEIKLLGLNETTLLIAFFTAPIIAFLGSLWFSKLLAGHFPKAYSIITGNRNPKA
jgi:peptidoglycan/LPS O-acetylase OafA/YrhL